MAGPNRLDAAGNNVSFPTWAFGKSTKLCVRSLDPNNYGAVTVQCGDAAAEQLGCGGGQSNCIDREWGGAYVNVVNSRNDMTVPVDVWTE